MRHSIPFKAILATLLMGTLIGCTASSPQAGRQQLVQSIAPELRLIGVPTEGLETFQTIRLAELKAIVDERPPVDHAARIRAMLIIDRARAEPAYGEGRADVLRLR